MSTLISNIDVSEFDGGGLDIIGTDGLNELSGTENIEFVDAEVGNDIVLGKTSDDLIDDSANNPIDAGKGDNSIIGGDSNDQIFGNFDDDYIHGGDGDDTNYGSAGNDTIFGDAGSDVFTFNAEDFTADSVDTVADFQLEEDRLVIKGLSENDAVAFDSTTSSISVNGNDVIDFSEFTEASEATIEQKEDGDYEII
ncbi:MAG: calcium-binding protein [Pleurocapsa sp. MO_192.B19]|nr:calcium-binding protein [Pleurocapsa sp. MO_192.B19]